MVPEQSDGDITREVATDLTGKEYYFGKDSSGLLVLAGAGEKALGIIQEGVLGTTTSRKITRVRTSGISRLKLAGTVSVGSWIKSDSDGKGVATTTDHDVYNAQALSDGVAGDIIAVKVITGTVSA